MYCTRSWGLLGCVLLLGVAGCRPADYPDDWPAPASFGGIANGGCPDLRGDYTGASDHLPQLLNTGRTAEQFPSAWHPHDAHVTQAADGSWLGMRLGLSGEALPKFREWVLKYRGVSAAPMANEYVDARRDQTYPCRGGWLHIALPGETYPVAVGRDRDGNLIFSNSADREESIGWGTVSISLGVHKHSGWSRWLRRDPARDRLPYASLQEVVIRRESRVRSNSVVAYRFNSFYLEPICVRIVSGTTIDLPHTRVWSRPRDSVLPVEVTCPGGWSHVATGVGFQREIPLPPVAPIPYRIEWFELSNAGKLPTVIDIPDVRELPITPEW